MAEATEFEIIQSEIDSIRQKYLGSVMDIVSEYNAENKTKIDYKRRQIYELLQNADDCHSTEYPQISVRMELRGNILIVQNTGVPFSARGILSLMHTDASSKHEDTIGCKGLGFRSVLNWAHRITVFTRAFSVDFSEERAKKNLEYYKRQSYAHHGDELFCLPRTAILTAAEVSNDKREIEKWLDPKFSTSIVMYCDDEHIAEIEDQLVNLKFEELLFLRHVNVIETVANGATRKVEAIKEGEHCIIKEGDFLSHWSIWRRSGEKIPPNGKPKKYELCLAYNGDDKARKAICDNGVLYSYFKTKIPMHFPFLVHGTFELTSERNSLVSNDPFNKLIIDELVDFICERGEALAKNSKYCDYEPLRFLLPIRSLGQLDLEYDFTSKLKRKIKNYKLLPSVCGEYISVNDAPKYSHLRFDELLLTSTCRNLLRRTDEKYISDYITHECGVSFYSDKELVKLIDSDAAYYVARRLNAKLITLYCESFRDSQVAPKLLTDTNGNIIRDDNVKIFLNSVTQSSALPPLPEWSKMYFLNPALESELSELLRERGRDLKYKLKPFTVAEYAFKSVLSELVAQSKDDAERTNATLAWLYAYREKHDLSAYDSLSDVDVRITTRTGKIASANKCYVGKEYDNEAGERLTSIIGDAQYVGSPEFIGLCGKNASEVKAFICELGVKLFPAVETAVELVSDETDEYLRYNAKKHPVIRDYHQIEYKHADFFNTAEKKIYVSSVKNIDKILAEADFYDIIFWLTHDEKLYRTVTEENEADYSSKMLSKPYRAKDYHEVRANYMASWLRKKFTDAQWLPTQSGKRVNVGGCTLQAHKLSPIVEVLSVDYAKLVKVSGKSRKELDLMLEKLGFVEDVSDLTPRKIYEVLQKLYENKVDPDVTKQVYTKLNMKYKAEALDELTGNNPSYEKFKTEGGVLAEQNGAYVYLPVNQVYYVDKKIYSADILKNYPLLVLEKRAGAFKIQKLFCVQPIRVTGEIKVDYVEHELDGAYRRVFQRILPYLYAKRIAVDYKSKEFSELKSTKIILVKKASAEYEINGKTIRGSLQDYELIYQDKTAYVKVPEQVKSVEKLCESIKFRGAVAEVLTTILDVDGDKDAFLTILSCKSTAEAEEYFIDNGDDNLARVNMAKTKFAELIDKKNEFWSAVQKALGVESIDQAKYSDFIAYIDFNDLNDINGCTSVIGLFKALGIDVTDYNKYAFDGIDLRPYYEAELLKLKRQYREKYFAYLLSRGEKIKTARDFYAEKQRYDGAILTAENSVNVCQGDVFEEKLGVALAVLDKMPNDYEKLLSGLPDESKSETAHEPTHIAERAREEKTDYAALNEKIAVLASGKSVRAELKAEKITHGASPTVSTGRTYESATNKAKEENGFIAESAVYNTLFKRYGACGSVGWVSGNGERARKCERGDDGLGYDIWYTDDSGKKHYVEVKGSTSENVEFNLTKNELEFAQTNAASYEIWYVHVVGKQPDVPYELGNLFLLGEGETFLYNEKFTVENSEYKIRATLVTKSI